MSGFLADAMLGRLARWLRAIGCDTAQLPVHVPDAEVVALARREDRVLLTRDRHLLRELRPPRGFEVRSDEPLEQLRSVVAAFGIARPAAFIWSSLPSCETTFTHAGSASRRRWQYSR